MTQSTIFQLCRVGATASWVYSIPRSDMYQYFRGVKCLPKGHNMEEVGLNPRPLALESDTLPLSHCAPRGRIVIANPRSVVLYRFSGFLNHVRPLGYANECAYKLNELSE